MEKISFEQLPGIASKIYDEVISLKMLICEHLNQETSEDKWLSLEELCEYLPGNPAKATIYAKVQKRAIPHKKLGRRLAFLKSEIDLWLQSKGRKTTSEIEEEAEQFLAKKSKGERSINKV